MKPTRDGEGVDVNKTSKNLPYPKTTPDEPEREKVEAILKKMRAAPSQIPWPYDLLKEAADLLHAAEKRAEDAWEENAHVEKILHTITNALEVARAERDSARAALAKVVEALKVADIAMTRDFCGWGDELNAIRSALKDAGK